MGKHLHWVLSKVGFKQYPQGFISRLKENAFNNASWDFFFYHSVIATEVSFSDGSVFEYISHPQDWCIKIRMYTASLVQEVWD